MIFAFGKFAIQAFVYVKRLGWKPKQVFVNAVAAATSDIQIASTSGQTDGAISVAFFKDPANPRSTRTRGRSSTRASCRSTGTAASRGRRRNAR